MRMKFGKLVRDGIPEKIINNGEGALIHTASDEEYWDQLKKKLLEECNEFIETENIDEIADIMEVIDSICEFKNIDPKDIESVKIEKKEKLGGFSDRVILDETD